MDEIAVSQLQAAPSGHRSGANRLNSDGDNVYEHSGAVALIDAWWPKFVIAEFEPVLGTKLFDGGKGLKRIRVADVNRTQPRTLTKYEC